MMSQEQNRVTNNDIGRYYNITAEDYEKIYEDYLMNSQEIIRSICDAIPRRDDLRVCVVDLGCGTGYQLSEIQSFLSQNPSYSEVLALGLDISSEMVDSANRRHSNINCVVGSFLDQKIMEILLAKVRTFQPNFVIVSVLGNTITHISSDMYPLFAQDVKSLINAGSGKGCSFVEFRDGDFLSREKPTFELRCHKKFDDEYILSFYVMKHEQHRYPTDIYIFKLSSLDGTPKLSVKRVYTKLAFYVRPEELKSAFSKYGEITNLTEPQSKLHYGKIWRIDLT